MPSPKGSTPADTAADKPQAAATRPSSATSLLRWLALVAGAIALGSLVFAATHVAAHWRLDLPSALVLAGGSMALLAWAATRALPALATTPATTAEGALSATTASAALDAGSGSDLPTVQLQRQGDRWIVVQGNPAAREAGLPATGTPAAQWLASVDPQLQADLKQHASAQADASETESFAYTVSHDLRAPIRVIEGFTRIVREDYGQVLDRIGNDHLDRVLGAAARMNSMIDALLALARLSSQPLARQRVDLSRHAQYVLDDLQKHAPHRRVDTRVMPGLEVEGDPTLLRLVLENLLGNAFKYRSRRDIAHIEFGAERRPVHGTAAAPDSPPAMQRVFYVSDDGAGFDMRFADRLFGAFQRLHSASEFQGTGVGLASVRRIVRRHGGDIWAEAEVDKGATFYFTLD